MALGDKVVLNVTHGGFGLSDEAIAILWSKHRVKSSKFPDKLARNSKALVDVVESLGASAAAYSNNKFEVVRLRPGKYVIYEYDGLEWITEFHRAYDPKTKRWRVPENGVVVTVP